MIKGWAKTKEIDTAFKLLNTMIEADLKPNIVTFNSLIDVWVRWGQQIKAWEIYRMIEGENDEENSIQGCGNAQNWKELSTHSPEYDEIQHNFTYCILIKGINPSGNQFQDNMKLNRAFKLLDKMKSNNENPEKIFIIVLSMFVSGFKILLICSWKWR